MNDEVGDSRFRYCPSCGLDSGTSDQFCRACGNSLTRTIKAPTPRDQSQSSRAPREGLSRTSRRFRIAVGLACLIVVAGVAVTIKSLAVPGKPSFTFSATDAENLNWRLSHIPTLPGLKGSSAGLVSVSCPTSSFCIAVGTRQYSDPKASDYYELPLVERFNGSRWTMEPLQSPDSAPQIGRLPEDQLTDVSCPTVRFCMAVGSFARLSTSTGLGTGVSGALVEIFNGRAWRTVELRASSKSDTNAYLEAVSCLQSRSCFVVGTAESPRVLQTLISYKYELGAFTSEPFGRVGKSSVDNLSHIYCSSMNHCLAVGTSSFGTFGSSKALAAVFAGHSWELNNPLTAEQQAEGVSDLADASCLSDGQCVTLGSVEIGPYSGVTNTQFGPIVESLRSDKWHDLVSPHASEFVGVSFDALDCRQTWCSMIGVQDTTLFVETYTDSGLHLSASVPSIPAKTGFSSVSCSSEGRCVAVGYAPSGPIALVGSLPSGPRPG
jgi:hypothetical protein